MHQRETTSLELVAVLILLWTGSFVSIAQQPAASDTFEKEVRPLFATHCVSCHGGESPDAGLDFTFARGGMPTSDAGVAVVDRKEPNKSRILKAISYADPDLRMPPDGRLPDAAIAAFTAWVGSGAYTPPPTAMPPPKATSRPEGVGDHWAFQPRSKPALSSTWIDDAIDIKLRERGLTRNPEADRRTWIRRVTFDLTGLPPTVQEISALLDDTSPDAPALVVDRLLASPAYGERFGRKWLDVARYADSNGLDENLAIANAWRYRDWVVRAINSDLPYDRFLTLQIAGDLAGGEGESDRDRRDRLIATGFLAIGPKMLAEQDKEKLRMDTVDEQVDVASKAFLGLTVACARCHDHKFDPISTEDYYAMAGVFRSTKSFANLAFVSRWNSHDLSNKEEIDARATWDREHTIKEAALRSAHAATLRSLLLPSSRLKANIAVGAARRSELAAHDVRRPPPAEQAPGVAEGEVGNVAVHLRGSHLSLGASRIARGPLALWDDSLSRPEIPPSSSGRLALAQWMTDPRHPLVARVAANRAWAAFFGTGLVRTPSNFGLRGETPTHPELLDALADHLVAHKWSMKSLHRSIVLSATYRQATATVIDERDPDHRWLAGFPRRRLDAEQLRDAYLSYSGELDSTRGGSLLDVGEGDYVTNDQSQDKGRYDLPRRTLYLPVIRNAAYDYLTTFDFGDPSLPMDGRPTTIVPAQALWLLNSPFVQARSSALTAWATKSADTTAARICALYERVTGRLPNPDEFRRAEAYLQDAPLDRFVRVLLASDAAIFLK